MKKTLTTKFNTRQYMSSPDYELYYYHDHNFGDISAHRHSHYEFYFFLEGDLNYEVDRKIHSLAPGDFLMIPPDISHRMHVRNKQLPYRRLVLWFSKEYYHSLCLQSGDFSFGYDYVTATEHYHYSPGFIISQDIQNKLIELLTETHSSHAFHELHCRLKAAAFLAHINRVLHDLTSAYATAREIPLYIRLCDYIDFNLTDELSLAQLANQFYVSKYHIAHSFKEHMGCGIHQYITRKRLQAIKNSIPSGIPLALLAQNYGFQDYSNFYRAFKREYRMAPNEYRLQEADLEKFKSAAAAVYSGNEKNYDNN